MRALLCTITLALVATFAAAAADVSAGAMTLPAFKERMHNRLGWTNRAQHNRCRPTFTMATFTSKPLADVLPGWRDEKLGYAVRKHHRAQARYSLCSPRAIGKAMAARRGWTGSLWDRLDYRITNESGWNPCRHFPRTTNCGYAGPNACGIPQAYPCSKLLRWCGAATIGGCPAREQIRWTLNYVAERYGSPAGLPPFPASY